jgi:hypothetical protein
MKDLITKLVPILHMKDPGAERSFYERLGLRTTYEVRSIPASSPSAITTSNSG